MVAPSCCLEYRPTVYFWLILFFGVFPSIYLCGKVVGCFCTVLLRVIRALCRIFLWDEEDEEEREKRISEERAKRREERHKRRAERLLAKQNKEQRLQTQLKASASNGKINGAIRNGTNGTILEAATTTTKLPPSDISDSLNSECEDDSTAARGSTPAKEAQTTIRHRQHHTLPVN